MSARPPESSRGNEDWAGIALATVLREGRGYEELRLDPPEIKALKAFCHRHRITSTFVSALAGSRLPKPTAEALAGSMRERCELFQGLRAQLDDALARIRTALDGEGVPWLLMKGVHLQQSYYRPLKRDHFDIDILVPGSLTARALAALGKGGWRMRNRGFVPLALVRLFEHGVALEQGTAYLDLHWTLRARPAYRIDASRLFGGQRQLRGGAGLVRVLDPEYDLTGCLLGLAQSIEANRTVLRDAVDLLLIVKALDSTLKWDAFLSERDREGTQRMCLGLLAAVTDWLDNEGALANLRRALKAKKISLPGDGQNPLRRSICGLATRAEGRRWFLSVYSGSKTIDRAFLMAEVLMNQEFPHNLPRTALFRWLWRSEG